MVTRGDITALADLLQGGGASPIVSSSIASSAIYDVQYRVAVTACAFALHARPDLVRSRRILAARLKLLQFIAIRPWLVPMIREWSDRRGTPQQSLLAQRLRHGFLGDVVHERVIDLVVASGMFFRSGPHVVSGVGESIISRIVSALEESQLFEDERSALVELKGITITNAMLEGW